MEQRLAAEQVPGQVPEQAPGMDVPRLLEDYGDSLLRLCTLWLGDQALAEDAVQDTFLKAMGAWHTFRGECSERTFLVRIAVNVCKNYLRSPWHRRREALPQDDRLSAPPPEAQDDTLLRTVMELPPKYRAVVVLYYYEELKTSEIASLLRVPLSTVTVCLSRARRLLRERLKGWYYDDE